ncbi:MAG: Hsp70 family protein [Gammaproteobacteria bacterium]|nr:Hsp70 family protein [Gammaproteobacteria bacterium]
MTIPIGIDLGTAYSTIAYFDGEKPRLIPNAFGETSMPSKVILLQNGSYCVGREAANHAERFESQNFTTGSVKRLMHECQGFVLNNRRFYPQVISALVLSKLKKQAEEFLKTKVDEAVICIPCNFGVIQRYATLEAAEMAGFKVLRMMNEATAAAVAFNFLSHEKYEEKEMIFDLGAGTLDLSIIEYAQGVIDVKTTEGIEFLGGDDFDNRIIKYVVDETKRTQGFDPIEDQQWEWHHIAKLRLKESAEKAKIELSSQSTTRIYIPYIRNILGKAQHVDVELGSAVFEAICGDLIDSILQQTDKVCKTGKFDFNKFVFTGGASKIACVRNKITSKYKGLRFISREKELVALGASLCSAVIQGRIKDLLILDCTGKSIGMGLKDDKFQVIIPKNSTIPTMKKDVFTTTADNQKYINVSVYEGENEKAILNRKIMDLELGPLDNEKAGVPKIEVTFEVDPNNVLTVNADQLEGEKEVEEEVSKVVPAEQPFKEKLKFWKEAPKKVIKVKEKVKHTTYAKKLQKFNLASPYKGLDPKIKNKIKELLNKDN